MCVNPRVDLKVSDDIAVQQPEETGVALCASDHTGQFAGQRFDIEWLTPQRHVLEFGID
jgi:hypothetical protein